MKSENAASDGGLSETPPPQDLPCGCHVECQVIDGVNTMIWTACAAGADCKWVKYAQNESEAQRPGTTTILDAR